MIRVTCTSCQKQLSLDESKLPASPVSFPCPVCKTKLTVDKRKYETAAPSPAPSATARDDDDDDTSIGEKALIVGADSPAIRHAATMIGLQPIHHAAPDAARDYFLREYPPVVFIHPQQITPPPLAEFASLISVTPQDRRKGFFILVADNMRTFDGNAAFLYGVNLILATKDLPSFQPLYREAEIAHDRMYAAMNAAFATP
jgi:predicted RNA-binding Zn-ribbon protein involved in translation (DUF1610 family)